MNTVKYISQVFREFKRTSIAENMKKIRNDLRGE